MARPHTDPGGEGGGSNGPQPEHEKIHQKIGEDRTSMLRALDRLGGEATVSQIYDEADRDIPGGSRSGHIRWLMGENVYGQPHPWWPEEVDGLIREVGREPNPKGGDPVRVVELTGTGKKVLQGAEEQIREGDVKPGSGGIEELRMAVQGRGSQIESLQERVDRVESSVDGSDGVDLGEEIESLEKRVTDAESKLNELERYIHEILDHLGADS